MKPPPAQTVAFNLNAIRGELYRRDTKSFWAHCLGTLLGTHGVFFDRSVQKTDRKTREGDGFFHRRLLNESSGPVSWALLSHFGGRVGPATAWSTPAGAPSAARCVRRGARAGRTRARRWRLAPRRRSRTSGRRTV